jgi:hypothetical protein
LYSKTKKTEKYWSYVFQIIICSVELTISLAFYFLFVVHLMMLSVTHTVA